MYMPSLRTQIYLTRRQRARLDELADRHDRSLAELIREAVDMFLDEVVPDPDETLRETFGSTPELETPARSEWPARD
jgi:hypothetical protein